MEVGGVIYVTCLALKTFSFADLRGRPFLHLRMKDRRATEQQAARLAGGNAGVGLQAEAPASPVCFLPGPQALLTR